MFKVPFLHTAKPEELRRPTPTVIPAFEGGDFAARYVGARQGGDFFDVARAGNRIIFVLLDIAGKREKALHIAAGVQDLFHQHAAISFDRAELNESEVVTDLMLGINRLILRISGSAHFSAGFLACFNLELGTICYINAGHTPAILRDSTGVTLLPASGLPLGLFLHATHDAQMSVLEPGALLMLVSRGVVEARHGSHEYGLGKVQRFLATEQTSNARLLCDGLLDDVSNFIRSGKITNDLTALVLARAAAAAAAKA